jgi:hypothetical protein
MEAHRHQDYGINVLVDIFPFFYLLKIDRICSDSDLFYFCGFLINPSILQQDMQFGSAWPLETDTIVISVYLCDLLSESKSIIGEIVNNLPNYSAIRQFLWVVVQQIWKVYRNHAKGMELPNLQEFRRMIIEPTDIVIEPQAIGLIHRDRNGNVIPQIKKKKNLFTFFNS